MKSTDVKTGHDSNADHVVRKFRAVFFHRFGFPPQTTYDQVDMERFLAESSKKQGGRDHGKTN